MRFSRAPSTAVLLGVGMVFTAGYASAQAWLPPKGEAGLTLAWSYAWADHHIDYLGQSIVPGDMAWNSLLTDTTYGITDRVAVRLNLPFVISKYSGPTPHPARPGHTAIDDGTWNATFTDFRGEVRFKATTGALAVTPMIALVVPSHWYESMGHSSPGRHLVEGQFGVNVGRVLDPLLPDAFLEARFYYAVPEQYAGVSHNRTNLVFNLGYFVTGALTVNLLGGWTHTYGGWRLPVDIPPRSSPDWYHHDQLIATEYLRLGAGATYAISPSVDVGVNGFATVAGSNDVNMSALTFTVSYGFSPSQIKRRQHQASKPPADR